MFDTSSVAAGNLQIHRVFSSFLPYIGPLPRLAPAGVGSCSALQGDNNHSGCTCQSGAVAHISHECNGQGEEVGAAAHYRLMPPEHQHQVQLDAPHLPGHVVDEVNNAPRAPPPPAHGLTMVSAHHSGVGGIHIGEGVDQQGAALAQPMVPPSPCTISTAYCGSVHGEMLSTGCQHLQDGYGEGRGGNVSSQENNNGMVVDEIDRVLEEGGNIGRSLATSNDGRNRGHKRSRFPEQLPEANGRSAEVAHEMQAGVDPIMGGACEDRALDAARFPVSVGAQSVQRM